MISVFKEILGIGLAASVACLASLAHAQPWPTKPIKLIVPFPAGGPTDLVGREAANILRGALGQAVIVENRPGGNGTVGLEVLAKSAPDGYTIGLTAITLSIAPHLGNAPFDPFKDFSPITHLVEMTPVVVTNVSLPLNNLKDLIAYAQAIPGKLAIHVISFRKATKREAGIYFNEVQN